MSRLTLTLLLLSWPAVAAGLQVSTVPDLVVLGDVAVVTITVKGIPGQGDIYGDVNVGSVERIEPTVDGAKVTYRPPKQTFPQMLALALWRDEGIDAVIHVVRLPLLGPTTIPVKTRAGARVRVRVAGRLYGPVIAGPGGRARVKLSVPPSARVARVEVTDTMGLKSNRRVAIGQPAFNQLALAITPHTVTGIGLPRFRVTAVAADPDRVRGSPLLQVGPDGVALEEQKNGLWTGVWAPASRPPEGSIALRLHLPGDRKSRRQAAIGITPGELTVRVRRVRVATRQAARSRLQGNIGVVIGMTHNLGELVAPRFGMEIGVEYELGLGLVGLRVHASYGWTTQRVSAPGLPDAESTVMLVPVGGGLTYRAPLPYLTPYVYWGCLAQIVRTTNRAPYLSPRLARTDVVFGVLGLVGASRSVGPGRVFVQLGYQWSRVDNVDVELLGGGMVLEGGYRLEL